MKIGYLVAGYIIGWLVGIITYFIASEISGVAALAFLVCITVLVKVIGD